MNELQQQAKRAADRYVSGHTWISGIIGSGKDGIVFSTSRSTAIKVYRRDDSFENELAVYQRMDRLSIAQASGHAIPLLIGWKAEQPPLIEMTIVQPPYVIDFAHAALDEPPDFPPEVIDDWHERLRDAFGSRYSQAMAVYNQLTRWGVYHMDFNPRNVAFADE